MRRGDEGWRERMTVEMNEEAEGWRRRGERWMKWEEVKDDGKGERMRTNVGDGWKDSRGGEEEGIMGWTKKPAGRTEELEDR